MQPKRPQLNSELSLWFEGKKTRAGKMLRRTLPSQLSIGTGVYMHWSHRSIASAMTIKWHSLWGLLENHQVRRRRDGPTMLLSLPLQHWVYITLPVCCCWWCFQSGLWGCNFTANLPSWAIFSALILESAFFLFSFVLRGVWVFRLPMYLCPTCRPGAHGSPKKV